MIQQKLQEAQLTALKSKDSETLSTVRYILSYIQNRQIDKKAELTDEEVIEVLRKIAKELRESIEAFQKGGRVDLLTQSKKQLELVSTYLPKEISDVDLKKEVWAVVNANKSLYEKNPKAVIGICIGKLKDKANPGRIVGILRGMEKG